MLLTRVSMLCACLLVSAGCAHELSGSSSGLAASSTPKTSETLMTSMALLDSLKQHTAIISKLKAESDAIDSLYRESITSIELDLDNLEALLASQFKQTGKALKQTLELTRAQLEGLRQEVDYLHTFQDVMKDAAANQALMSERTAMLREITELEQSFGALQPKD